MVSLQQKNTLPYRHFEFFSNYVALNGQYEICSLISSQIQERNSSSLCHFEYNSVDYAQADLEVLLVAAVMFCTIKVSPFPVIHNNCCLLFHLLMHFGSLYWKFAV